jgi:hypothetical protein
VRIAFDLSREAAIEIAVFDLQGRLLATPAHGVWPAGSHSVEWRGQIDGAPAAAGVYLVRYRYPGGEDRRRLVRTP